MSGPAHLLHGDGVTIHHIVEPACLASESELNLNRLLLNNSMPSTLLHVRMYVEALWTIMHVHNNYAVRKSLTEVCSKMKYCTWC